MTYSIGSRTFRKGGIATPAREVTVKTIERDGRFYADVPAGEDADAIVRTLNNEEEKARAYRAQFATEEEFQRNIDEASGG